MNYSDKVLIGKAKLWLKKVEGAECHITERGQLRTNGKLFKQDVIKYALKVEKGQIKIYDSKGKRVNIEAEKAKETAKPSKPAKESVPKLPDASNEKAD